MPGWRTAHASVVGTSHAVSGAPCQDAGGCQVLVADDGREILLTAVADGAGSASRSEEGAQLAVRSFLSHFGSMLIDDPELSTIDAAGLTAWISGLRAEIAGLAAAEARTSSDYACTFLAAIVAPTRAAFMQIGDGAIVVTRDGSPNLSWVFWPQHGEFANSTSFVTQDDFETVLEIIFIDAAISEVAIFSDGIERLVLDLSARVVHSPALRPIFEWLSRTDPSVQAPGPHVALAAFLGSERVNRRTDDDKTLVMATRAVGGQGR